MFEMRLREVVRTLVDSAMEAASENKRETQAAVISLDVRLHNYTGRGNQAHRSTTLHFLFHRPHGNTHTFFAESQYHAEPKKLNWEFLSSHDSCWIDAVNDRISKIYFEMAREVERESGVDIRPIDLSQSVYFVRNSPVMWMCVSVKRDERDVYEYKKVVCFGPEEV